MCVLIMHTVIHFIPTVLELHKHQIKMNFLLDSQIGLSVLRVRYDFLSSSTPKKTSLYVPHRFYNLHAF